MHLEPGHKQSGRPERIYLTASWPWESRRSGRRLAERLEWTFIDLDEAVTLDGGRIPYSLVMGHGPIHYLLALELLLEHLEAAG